jgi:hypothetical protein
MGGEGFLEAEAELAASRVKPFYDLKPDIWGDFLQGHHLDQAAGFRGIIPYKEGTGIRLQGDAITEPLSPHGRVHDYLDAFFDQFQPGGARHGEFPTSAEYGATLADSMRAGGFSKRAAQRIADRANTRRLQYMRPDEKLTHIPKRLRPKR